ncbi:MAG TPA: hypothetical protein VMM79_14870 [Longimicrobiales bacterium]|nr:hypothetical protein [Longimicrobiales bacterium]
MHMHRSWSGALLTLAVTFAGACGGDAVRSSGARPETDREIELALRGDTGPATFEDIAIKPLVKRPDSPVAIFPVMPVPVPGRQPQPPTPAQPEIAPEQPAEEPEPVLVTRIVPVGTTLQLSLNEMLSTRSNEEGDAFTATLTSHILDADGTVLIPAGATLRGRVTGVQKSGRVGETAVLSLAFEAVSFGDESYPLEASVVSANPERVSRESTAEQVGKVAVGTAAGAILGQVIGRDTRSTIVGAVAGAVAGTAIAMGTADVDAVLKKGSAMVVRTETPVSIVKIVN